jgi:hypothetical protein
MYSYTKTNKLSVKQPSEVARWAIAANEAIREECLRRQRTR